MGSSSSERISTTFVCTLTCKQSLKTVGVRVARRVASEGERQRRGWSVACHMWPAPTCFLSLYRVQRFSKDESADRFLYLKDLNEDQATVQCSK